MQIDLINSLKKILESEEQILFYFKDNHIEYSTMLNNYDIEINDHGINVDFDWTNIIINLDDVIKYSYCKELNGYSMFGDDWSMYIHTSGTM